MTLLALAAAKAMMASSAFVLPLAKAADRVLGPRGCCLTFHRTAPSEQWERLPNRDFYVDADFLDRFLSYVLEQGWDVVTMDEALRRAAAHAPAGRYVNISIDDCYRDTFELLAPVFRRHNVPVTLFVTTGIPDGTLPLWAAGLEDALLNRDRLWIDGQQMALSSNEQRRALFAEVAARWDGPQAAGCYAAFCAANGMEIEAMHWKHAISWDMLEALARDPLVEIGAHTVSHARISSLSPEDALKELAGARLRLNARLGIDVKHFAFPYGRAADCGPRDFALAREAGFASAATTRKGLVHAGQDAFSIPRNTMNGAHRSLAAMELHLTGLSGTAARVMGRV
ncbi:putative Polysaccharide deacetylase [Bradyrhizobium sp. ORS 285]|uniref:polysaccharide deacetylase family protein n=1 Tax=Bradyrhizobium sp. ORS 285 TaxID=115808 RepID=UPI0002407F00|nr:polysaccharide deacetylase family protein [Bradyrhizobium sp. ORS 285]CCD89073.1 putative Polysaccharide deacetylase [Bradyrhizobium sp. ORS 285]SMX61785.1 putative Polysaccharide deacetylase [Bradyrhizobium sp. ORS 285]